MSGGFIRMRGLEIELAAGDWSTLTFALPTASVRVVVPNIRLRSLNQTLREHSKRRHERQGKLCAQLRPFLNRALTGFDLTGALVVTLGRVAPRPYDGDNWPAGDCKAVRDLLAREYLRRDDRETATLAWAYEQRAAGVREYALEIRIERRSP